MPSVVRSLFHDLSSPDTEPPAWAASERVWLFLFMIILVPLCFLRKLDSLRHTSYIALFTVGECITSTRVWMIINVGYLHCSLSCRNRNLLLFLSSWRYCSEGRRIPCKFHNQLHYNIPRTSFWIHLCPECETIRYLTP